MHMKKKENFKPWLSILRFHFSNSKLCIIQRGPNKVPLYSMAVVAVTTLSFILVGQINTLAPIVTMPFLLTYAAIDYSYFALAQTHEIQLRREDRFRYPSIIIGTAFIH
jgi:amino acid transporter